MVVIFRLTKKLTQLDVDLTNIYFFQMVPLEMWWLIAEMCWLIAEMWWLIAEMWWLFGDVVAHWQRSRLLRQWSRVRIRHLSQ